MSTVQELYTLKNVYRWNGTGNGETDTTAQHSYYVTCITGMLADIYEGIHPGRINKEHLLIMALYHDIGEVSITHITYGAKRCSENLNEEVRKLKEEMLETWYRQIGRSDIMDDKNRTGVYKDLIDFADNLDAWMHCKGEVNRGNSVMEALLMSQKNSLIQKVKKYDWATQFYQEYLMGLL